jgi:serine/threonine-protein kinase RsbW
MSYGKSEEAGSAPMAPGERALVSLTIPCSPEYVGTARLTILGVASRMGFSYDQIEDIRLAVGEACANSIERSGYRPGAASRNAQLTIRSHVEPSRLTVEVEDNGRGTGGVTGAEGTDVYKPASEIEGMNSQELGALLMEILVDEVSVEALEGGGTRVRLTKYANES